MEAVGSASGIYTRLEAAARIIVAEAARRLGLDGPEVYRLIEAGELAAGKGADGLVYVSEEALRYYEEQHAKSAR